MPDELEALFSDGWRDAINDPPDTGRIVQIAYEDGSHGKGHNGCFDSINGDEKRGRVWWCTFGGIHLCPNISAWKELENANVS